MGTALKDTAVTHILTLELFQAVSCLPASFLLLFLFFPGLITSFVLISFSSNSWQLPWIHSLMSGEQSQLQWPWPQPLPAPTRPPTSAPSTSKGTPARLCLMAPHAVRGSPSPIQPWLLSSLSQPILPLAWWGDGSDPEVVVGPPGGLKPRLTASLRHTFTVNCNHVHETRPLLLSPSRVC